MTTFSLPTRGPFSLDSARSLLCGCMRASRACTASGAAFAFPLDGTFQVVGAAVRHAGDRLDVTVTGTADVDTLSKQLARVLCVDHDGEAFAKVLASEAPLASIASPGFRPVVFFSPYVAAGWHLLAHRIRMTQAAVLQARIAEAVGDVIEVDGVTLPSFPRPESLLKLKGFPGITAEKWERLQGLARAALGGKLEVAHLTSMEPARAMAELQALRGVGPLFAEGTLLRGCGPTDALPLEEKSLHEGVRRVYDLDHVPSHAELERVAEAWRPFRMWVTVLMVREALRGGVRPRGAGGAGRRGRGARRALGVSYSLPP